jgi:hypothetical protein
MFNGEWGRVCNSSWGDKEAGVFCRQLGYIDGIKSTFETRSKGHVWMNYIECSGTEKSILECSNTWTPGSANCDDAGVVCLKSGKTKLLSYTVKWKYLLFNFMTIYEARLIR